MRNPLIYGVALVLLTPAAPAFADGNVSNEVVQHSHAHPDATPNQASDASFDKRLPPVLPGETLNDSGKKIKVWSTSGPVPVSDAPEPWNDRDRLDGQGKLPAEVGVIVDRRKDE